MLQTFTTAASKILTDVYNVPADSFKFDLMYMPMNSNVFRNDLYAEVCYAVLGFTMLALSKIATRFTSTMEDPNENSIKEMLRRLGMRKTVEFSYDTIMTIIFCVPLVFLLVWLATSTIFMTTSYGFLLITCGIFMLR